MKKESPFWSSISLLIGIVIAILALVRGRMLLPLLLAVFALWLLWWLLTQALPLWRNNRAYRAKEARLREQTAAANGGGQLADALLCHVNYRITAMLHAAYPNARWEWLADKPSRFAVEGGTARIRVYGIPDFDYADVKLDQKANLDCSLVKLSPLVAGASDTQPPNRQPVNPRVWFETRGRAVLEALVTDLNSRGHSSLTVQENGEVLVKRQGVIICKVVEEKFWRRDNNGISYSNLNKESVLHIMGYNVSEVIGLTSIQRHRILEMIVDEHILSRMEICNHLDWLIERNSYRDNFKYAIEKWTDDREYIANYNTKDMKIVDVGIVTRRTYKKQ